MSGQGESGSESVKVFPIQLTSWIESQPDLAYLVEAANNTLLYTKVALKN